MIYQLLFFSKHYANLTITCFFAQGHTTRTSAACSYSWIFMRGLLSSLKEFPLTRNAAIRRATWTLRQTIKKTQFVPEGYGRGGTGGGMLAFTLNWLAGLPHCSTFCIIYSTKTLTRSVSKLRASVTALSGLRRVTRVNLHRESANARTHARAVTSWPRRKHTSKLHVWIRRAGIIPTSIRKF